MLIKTAGLTVSVENAHPGLCGFCKNYTVSSGEPELSVSLCEEKPDAQVIELCRAVCDKMLEKDGFLLHSSALAFDGKGVLFTALSGTGKSTHSRMWREVFGDRVMMVNDDKPILRFRDNDLFVCGTPWCGKHSLETNTEVPVRALVFLIRGDENLIERVSPDEIIARIFDQVQRPSEPEKLDIILSLLDRMLSKTPLFRLYCRPDHDAATVAFEGLKGVLL